MVESFFKNDEGHNVIVNGDRYRALITNFFIPELNNHDVQELWFQQDGARCHTARATIDLLKDTFGDHLISRFGPVNWPPRSCDLTPLDYFLWGYVKSLVYADKPQTLDHLDDNIHRVIADIRPQMLEKVIENWTSRLDYIRASVSIPLKKHPLEAYGGNALSRAQCYRWFEKFPNGDFDVRNEERGRPAKKFEDAELQALLDEDDGQTQEHFAEQLNVDQSTVSRHRKAMGKIIKVGRWVPHELMGRQQENRKIECEMLLACNKRVISSSNCDWC
ncbi:mariner Mos1 transposase [Trichonephila clavipes]|nr:mariner Mos1 transposase [Trichonephila clavipes]